MWTGSGTFEYGIEIYEKISKASKNSFRYAIKIFCERDPILREYR